MTEYNKFVITHKSKKYLVDIWEEVLKMGSKFDELWNDDSFITAQEREQTDFQVELISKMVEARESRGMT